MWAARLNRANASHTEQLAGALRREFKRLLKEIDPKKPALAVAKHAVRLNVILAAHKRSTAATFGFLALEMLRTPDNNAIRAKADGPRDSSVSRAEQVSAILVELARTVAAGAMVALIAEALARDRQLVAAVEGAILSAASPDPAAIATTLLENRHVQSRLLAAHAAVAVGETLPTAPANANAGQFGGSPPAPPPAPPPGGAGSGGEPPRRSRFSELVERLVREEAPVRARRIARTSGDTIARVLARGAREGWSERRTSQELQAALGDQVGDFRARVIARTELGAAQNAATLAIARDRAAAGAKLEKVWVAIDDRRTRESHAEADDQVRGLDEPFHVGKASLQHPGDPRAPLGEIVNCRCAMLIRRVAA